MDTCEFCDLDFPHCSKISESIEKIVVQTFLSKKNPQKQVHLRFFFKNVISKLEFFWKPQKCTAKLASRWRKQTFYVSYNTVLCILYAQCVSYSFEGNQSTEA